MSEIGRSLVVIDLDCRDGANGVKSLGAYAYEQRQRVPGTRIVATPRGLHLLFWTDLDLRNRRALLPGVDVRGDGGYVVAVGSVTPDGTYEWMNNAEIQELPAWLVPLIERDGRRSPSRSPAARIPRVPKRSEFEWDGDVGVLATWDRSPELKRRIQRTLDVGERFVPFWRPSESGADTAGFWRDEAGYWIVRDYGAGKHDAPASLTLTQFYFSWQTKTLMKFKGEQGVWKIRMLDELGLLTLVPLIVCEAPSDMSALARGVYAEMVYLTRCRWTAEYGADVVASLLFLKRWAKHPPVRSASPATIGRARAEIIERGLYVKVGEVQLRGGRRPTPLLLPRGHVRRTPTPDAVEGPS
jgi:hypothetical protein